MSVEAEQHIRPVGNIEEGSTFYKIRKIKRVEVDRIVHTMEVHLKEDRTVKFVWNFSRKRQSHARTFIICPRGCFI